ncbi:MAG: N-acetylmuramoyl-L-alanine amidase [Clostridium sp.]|uniref:hypothetical protein n=1 Tax=Clostridium sp. TaxID=1506 RepID=UPI002A842377|nr:N-acetylmuramoyl-L-alanine amidase [Clostridium sp.]MDY5098422.1 hypothetical protein [Clostridium sp.]
MKYGIDAMVNCWEEETALNHYVKNYMIKKINDLGHVAVNCQGQESKNFGERLYNKVKIANNARVDLFFSINIVLDKTNSVTLYTKGDIAEAMAEKIIKSLDELKFSSGKIINESKLYLIKNMKSEVLLADIKLNTINEAILNEISEKILKIIVI